MFDSNVANCHDLQQTLKVSRMATSKGMQFMDMCPELILMVTDHLLDAPMINLVDIIPVVRNQGTTSDMDRVLAYRWSTGQGNDVLKVSKVSKVLEQFEKVTGIKKVVIPDGVSWDRLKSLMEDRTTSRILSSLLKL